MAKSFAEIEQQARQLTAEERAKLVESLLESLHTPLSDMEAAWAQEIEDRVAAFDRGEMPAYAAEDVFAEARRRATSFSPRSATTTGKDGSSEPALR